MKKGEIEYWTFVWLESKGKNPWNNMSMGELLLAVSYSIDNSVDLHCVHFPKIIKPYKRKKWLNLF
jgi:hypothetical protein